MEQVRQLLEKGDRLDSLQDCSQRQLIRTLNMLISDGDEIVKQRACRELGKIIASLSQDKIQNFLRRLLWRLNPESGDNPVGVPELLGEIVHYAPQQTESFVSPFLYYFGEETLWPGLLQAAGRIGEKLPGIIASYIDEVSAFQRDENTLVAGSAVLALSRINDDRAKYALRLVQNDGREVTLFCGGEFRKTKLSDLASHRCEHQNELCFITSTA